MVRFASRDGLKRLDIARACLGPKVRFDTFARRLLSRKIPPPRHAPKAVMPAPVIVAKGKLQAPCFAQGHSYLTIFGRRLSIIVCRSACMCRRSLPFWGSPPDFLFARP